MVYLEKVPEGRIYNLDNKYLAEQIVDEFFLNTEEYILSICDYYNPSDFETKFGEISYPKQTAKDKLTSLILKDEKEKIVAGVLCSQIGLRDWIYTFFRDLSFLK